MSLPGPDAGSFASRLLAWFDQHGRHDLPWQHPRSAYRVWLSEVMLQQTQVAAVIPYFERFLGRFPDLRSLAEAPGEEVMRYWAGLGYYARARNLHAAARAVVERHGGEFPSDYAAVLALPGIGRSTAGAILAQAHGQRHAILDGNVKRVLSRWAGIAGWPGEAAVAEQLWACSERLLPETRLADYTQALMDLGASLCSARKPRCGDCPLAADCRARLEGRTAELPGAKPKAKKKARPQREAWLIVASDEQGRWLLEQRPGAGIWGGLWCPPVVDLAEDWAAALQQRHGLRLEAVQTDTPIDHAFSHYDLRLHPLRGRLVAPAAAAALRESVPQAWHHPAELSAGVVALPAPIARYAERQAAPTDLLGQTALASVRRPRRRATPKSPSPAS
ncbi:MAG: A/G-specific adenine glycosylase [Nevskiaceae bacterium]|nr:MAG: A/G-specific adenine glycosylase [Nevskiaceae bacterium]